MEKKHSVLQKILQTMFVIMVPVGVATVWFGFLLLPVEWWLSWLTCVVFLAVGTYISALSRREFSRSGQKLAAEAYGTSKLITSGIYSLVPHPPVRLIATYDPIIKLETNSNMHKTAR